MILVTMILLFVPAFVAGALGMKVASLNEKTSGGFLVFAGSYLFSISIIHVLPDLYEHSGEGHAIEIGIVVLIGFFFQQVLEFFTQGVEHGHMHSVNEGHKHGKLTSIYVVSALSIHALLEGTIVGGSEKISAVLLGIILHKIPAALALVSILLCQIGQKKKVLLFLIIFSLASPAGALFGSALKGSGIFFYLLGLVTGGFLHISTTIVFESMKDHRFNKTKLLWSITGALVAVLSEVIFL